MFLYTEQSSSHACTRVGLGFGVRDAGWEAVSSVASFLVFLSLLDFRDFKLYG